MYTVGIDVSKGKSMISVMRPGGEEVLRPFEVHHTSHDLTLLCDKLKSLGDETRVVMEATGSYHLPIAWLLDHEGFYVSVVNPILIHGYGNNSIRRGKTDRKDALKIAGYGLQYWNELPRYMPQDPARQLLKTCYRQYQEYSKTSSVFKNSLISLMDLYFPGVNDLFTSPVRPDGSQKWIDFVAAFGHCDCVRSLSERAFITRYQRWCAKHSYQFSPDKAKKIHAFALNCVAVSPNSKTVRILVDTAVSQLRTNLISLAAVRAQMQALASSLPEYPVVMSMFGAGPSLGPQLMAEIGDVRRFHSKKALVAFAGIDAPPCQSGQVNVLSRSISKRGSPALRRTLFLVMNVINMCSPAEDPVYQYMAKKRSEGKKYQVYMMASANKFLRRYYASVNAYLGTLGSN